MELQKRNGPSYPVQSRPKGIRLEETKDFEGNLPARDFKAFSISWLLMSIERSDITRGSIVEGIDPDEVADERSLRR